MKKFVEMSKYAGMREDLVQAGGGNSSYKMSKDRMAIKASGCQLADVKEEKGYALVNPQVISQAFLDNDNIAEMTEKDSNEILNKAFISGARPSIETFLHSISGTYTLHTHPIVVNAFACRKGGMETLKELFPEALIVPYATPGVELAKAYFAAFQDSNKNTEIVFLQNHGLLVSGKSADEVIDTTEKVVTKLENVLELDMSDYHAVTKLYQTVGKGIVWKVTDKHILDTYKDIGGVWKHTFCPDCVVFLGKQVLAAGDDFDKGKLCKFEEKYGTPVLIEYHNTLYICAESVKKAFEIQSVLSFSAQVMNINKNYECNLLSDSEQNFLLHWDAEKYRKDMK